MVPSQSSGLSARFRIDEDFVQFHRRTLFSVSGLPAPELDHLVRSGTVHPAFDEATSPSPSFRASGFIRTALIAEF
jgi:hypothetical protein